jgi:RNA polymerase sigma-70 factor (ECF subfamily)
MSVPRRSEGAAAAVPVEPRSGLPSAGASAGAGPAPPAGDGSDGPSDEDLVRAAREGDEAAFEALYRRHEVRAWRVAKNLVGNREDAGDLVQEAFLRVFRSLDRFDFEHEFTTWLYRIVTNLAIDHLRHLRQSRIVRREDASESLPGGASPGEGVESDEARRAVRRALDALPPKFKTVMVLRELHGLSCKEIASIVASTHATVRWRLHRARTLFREAFERSAPTGVR